MHGKRENFYTTTVVLQPDVTDNLRLYSVQGSKSYVGSLQMHLHDGVQRYLISFTDIVSDTEKYRVRTAISSVQ